MNAKNRFFLLFISLLAFSSMGQHAAQLHELVEENIFSHPERSLEYAKQEKQVARKNSREEVRALVDLGKCHYYADRYEEGEGFLRKALKIARDIKDKEGLAWAFYHIGDLDILQGEYGSAIANTSNALQLFQQLKNSEGTALGMNGIGLIYLQQQNYQEAMTYFKSALNYGNDVTRGDSYSNLSRLYMKMEAYDDARAYGQKALKKGIQNDDKYVQSTAYDVLGFVALKHNEFLQAEGYLRKSMQLKSGLEDDQGVSITCLDLATAKKAMGQADSARYYTRLSFRIADRIGAKEEIKDAAYLFSKLLASTGKYDSAFFYQNRYIQLNDEIYNEKASRKMAEMEAAVSEQKDRQQIELLEQEKAFETKAKSLYLVLGIIGVVLLTLTVFFMYNRYNLKKKAHDNLEMKNHIIEEQNKEILESIRYAKRLQEAILPEMAFIRQTFPESFVSYLPKDIVAGDFYWFEKREDVTMIACCDCTGHGVPGAMVSVVCSNAMNRVVRELNKTIPGGVLDETRRLVVENFNQRSADTDVKDGMDVSLLVFNPDLSSVQFAGANHALWIIRKGADDLEIVKGDKQPVGKYDHYKPFETHTVPLNPGDRIYLFTDGYADQFGGGQAKKMKTPALKNKLLEIQHIPLLEHQQLLEDFFQQWKGREEQVDDVSFMAFEL